MKLLGISCGRKMGSSEILLKEALMGAEENKEAIDVEMLRLNDFDIKPCRFCKICLRIEGGPDACIVKDDVSFIIEKFMQADGLIISAPVYILAPPGNLKLLADRMQPDIVVVMMLKNMGGVHPQTGKKVYLDERVLKKRVGAFISVGGAVTPHWVSFGMPMMHCNTFPRQIDLVDQMQVLSVANNLGAVVLNESKIRRARQLGGNVAVEMVKLKGKRWQGDELSDTKKQTIDKPKWYGDDTGVCPVCHSNLLMVGKENPVECPICGSKGTLKIINNKITVDFTEEEQAISRLALEGKYIHQVEIRACARELQPQEEIIAERVKKYQAYLSPLKPSDK